MRDFYCVSLSMPLLLSLVSAVVTAQEPKGSKDHPLISRYPGSTIESYEQKKFDQFNLHVGPCDQTKCNDLHLEGKVTAIRYRFPTERSAVEVLRNYQQGLDKAGFQQLFQCTEQDCGSETERTERMKDFGRLSNRYLSAKLSRAEGDVYVGVNVVERTGMTYVVVVESKPMEGGLVTVDAAALGTDIGRTGHTAVYGILFDTGKADVKPESSAALKEIAKLLQQEPNLKLYVVGHTDNAGVVDHNMDLSRRRADSVVKELATKYKVATARLHAIGDGPSAPVASNDNEEGRAKNRRVELVKQ